MSRVSETIILNTVPIPENTMARKNFQRASRDIGNIIALDHLNITVPDQQLATLFYVNGLGLTRDPYMDFGPANVWINAGRQQVHLPTASPQTLRGRIVMVIPDLDALERRLTRLKPRLVDTRFGFRVLKNRIDVTCPWGNRFQCHGPGAFGRMSLGIACIEFDVPPRTTSGIARFYSEVIGVRATARKGICEIQAGIDQLLRFREKPGRLPAYDGHHIAVYLADFSGPYRSLRKHGLITEESDENQYRFQTIMDPRTGKSLFEVEHEVRSLHHPMFNRPLVNRNAGQSFFDYRQGQDVFVPPI